MIGQLSFLIFSMDDGFDNIKEFWNKEAFNYDNHMLRTGHYDAQDKIIESFVNYIKSPIIDLAAGPGHMSENLVSRGFTVSVNDFSHSMIEICKDKLKRFHDVRFTQDNAETIVNESKFSTIVCANLFYYLKNRKEAINSWKSILNKDGIILVIEEYPFQKPDSQDDFSNEERLMELIDPLSPNEIKEYFSEFKLIDETKISIDDKHDLFGFVFQL